MRVGKSIVSTCIFSGGYGQYREMEGFFARAVMGGTDVNGLREKRTVLQLGVLASRIGSKSCSCSHWLI